VRLAHLVAAVVVPALAQVRLAPVHRARRALLLAAARRAGPLVRPASSSYHRGRRRRRRRGLPGRGLPAPAVRGGQRRRAAAVAELEVDRALGPPGASWRAAVARRIHVARAGRRRARGRRQVGQVPRRGRLEVPVHGRHPAPLASLSSSAHSEAAILGRRLPSLSSRGRFFSR
jgi:hypothetical protein